MLVEERVEKERDGNHAGKERCRKEYEQQPVTDFECHASSINHVQILVKPVRAPPILNKENRDVFTFSFWEES